MRISKTGGLAAAALLAMPSLAMAHAGHDHGQGALHVFLAPEHALSFVALGGALAVVLKARRAWTVFATCSILVAFLGWQATAHAAQSGALFGAQVALTGAILTLGAWRGVTRLGALASAADRAAQDANATANGN